MLPAMPSASVSPFVTLPRPLPPSGFAVAAAAGVVIVVCRMSPTERIISELFLVGEYRSKARVLCRKRTRSSFKSHPVGTPCGLGRRRRRRWPLLPHSVVGPPSSLSSSSPSSSHPPFSLFSLLFQRPKSGPRRPIFSEPAPPSSQTKRVGLDEGLS